MQIVYDIQENYYRNILFSKAFPPLIKQILAVWVRLKEVVLAPFVDHFFLAEKGYQNELNFSRRRFTILENKCGVVYPPTHRDPSKMKMIFSGTLSEVTGVFRAIALVKKLREINPKITLTIVGFTPVATTYERIQNEISGCPFITLIGGNCLVPHKQVLAEIASADFGLVSYYTPPSIENSIPTKLYEYLAHRLPMVLQNHSPWAELCAPYPAAIVVNFDQPLVDEILKAMTSKSFYVIPPQNVTWQSEEGRLLEAISSLT